VFVEALEERLRDFGGTLAERCREVCLPIHKSTRLLAVVDTCEK
jgi:hypothetical protein